jgi:hypothetical protein
MRLSRYSAVARTALLGLLLANCRTTNEGVADGSFVKADDELEVIQPGAGGTGVLGLPTLVQPNKYTAIVHQKLANVAMPDEKREEWEGRFAHYLAFVGIPPAHKETANLIDRLLESSTQFLLCDSFENWACLEETPWIKPKKKMRQEKANANLGKVVRVEEPLRVQAFFTNQWDKKINQLDMSTVLAQTLAQKIESEAQQGLSMALYGIDEIDGSMKPVYDAILGRKAAGVPVRAVLDTEGAYDRAEADFPWVVSYIKPAGNRAWAYDLAPDQKNSNVAFQYHATVDLMNALNRGIARDDESVARVEWNQSIMHNKFMVFKKPTGLSVWSGTANVADTCMGTERNTNMGLFIDNTAVAQEFQSEFEEMFAVDTDHPTNGGDKYVAADGTANLPIGHFHGDKTPNTHRYFQFSDGTELRLHFAPTDDGEHRSVIPMLLSARRGDDIRISMFGAGGIEYVRAMQYAQSVGANVYVMIDKLVGSIRTGWVRDDVMSAPPSPQPMPQLKANLLYKNPYNANPQGEILVRRASKVKQNHHKTATLTRKEGEAMRPEVIIIGSQNWSVQGNDENDENMVSLRSKTAAVPLGEMYNQHYDERLWEVASTPDDELHQGQTYCEQVTCPGGS